MGHKALKHICPECGAVYEMTENRRSRVAYHTAVCSYCGDVMAEWDGGARHYHRVKRPQPLTQAAKVVADIAAANSDKRKSQGARARSKTLSPVERSRIVT